MPREVSCMRWRGIQAKELAVASPLTKTCAPDVSGAVLVLAPNRSGEAPLASLKTSHLLYNTSGPPVQCTQDTSGECWATKSHFHTSLVEWCGADVRCITGHMSGAHLTPLCQPLFSIWKTTLLHGQCIPDRSGACKTPLNSSNSNAFEFGIDSNHPWGSSGLPSASFYKCAPHPLNRFN